MFDKNVEEYVRIVNESIDIHENQRFQGFFSDIGMVSGDYINFQMPDNLVVVGDLHGDFSSLEKIMEKIDYASFLNNESNLLIFLGDYIDRGKYSLEVLLLLCKIKNLYPNNVFMLRGNHESYIHFPFSSYNFRSEVLYKLGESAEEFYENNILKLFESLFVFSEIDGFSILTHGGLPVIQSSEFFNNYKFHLSAIVKNKQLLEEFLWNDPRELSIGRNWEFSNRGLGKYFGINVTNSWLSNIHCNFLLRGHEPCKGYRLNHENKVVTIFSSKDPYPNFESSFLMLSKKDLDYINDDGLLLKQFIHLL